jgi:hypothetical protein
MLRPHSVGRGQTECPAPNRQGVSVRKGHDLAGKTGEMDAQLVVCRINGVKLDTGPVVYNGRVLYDPILFKKNEKVAASSWWLRRRT